MDTRRLEWSGGGEVVVVVVVDGARGVDEGPGRAPLLAPAVLRVRVALAPLCMSFGVFSKMVRAHESLITDGAGESLLSCVCAQMPLKLVGAREALPAKEPVADEGPLAGVPAQMGLKMGSLPVHLAAAGDVTVVKVFLAYMGTGRPQPFCLLAVGTITDGPPGVAPLRPRR